MKNKDLIEKVIKLVAEERRIGVAVLELLQEIGLDVDEAQGGLARAYVLQGKYDEAQDLVQRGVDHCSAAEVWLAMGERDKATELARAAFKKAWALIPPVCILIIHGEPLHLPMPVFCETMLQRWANNKFTKRYCRSLST